jgi:peptidoglycan/xylan/chitin deacetylase (PgdA/CDA1 family)
MASQAMLAALDTMSSGERTRLLDVWQQKVPAPEVSDLPLLGWDQLRSLVRDGATIGGHTHRHDRLGSLDSVAVAADLEESAAAFRAQGMDVPSTFAYPSGDFNDETAEVVAHAGYRLAFTTRHGFLDGAAPDAYHVPRTSLGDRIGADLMARIAFMQIQQLLPIRLRKRRNEKTYDA